MRWNGRSRLSWRVPIILMKRVLCVKNNGMKVTKLHRGHGQCSTFGIISSQFHRNCRLFWCTLVLTELWIFRQSAPGACFCCNQ